MSENNSVKENIEVSNETSIDYELYFMGITFLFTQYEIKGELVILFSDGRFIVELGDTMKPEVFEEAFNKCLEQGGYKIIL